MKPQIALVMLMLAGPAFAAGLEKDAHVTEMLVAGQVGDILRTQCRDISARMFVVMGELLALERYAKSAGNSDAEIQAFLKNGAQKARIKSLATAYLKQAGAVAGDADSYCAVGRAEIAAQTTAGKLIR